MKILFDECVPWPVHKLLVGHDCMSVQRRGWSGVTNGELLRLAQADYDLFITADQSLRFQQNLAGSAIAILQLSTNKLRPILSSAALLLAEVRAIKPGEFRRVQIP